MSHCRFCGKSVFLRGAHSQCQKKHEDGKSEIQRLICDAVCSGMDLTISRHQAEHLASASYVSASECIHLISLGWNMALDRYLENGQLDAQATHRVQDAAKRLALTPELLKNLGVEQKLTLYRQVQERKRVEEDRRQSLARSRQQTLDALRRGQFPKYPYPTPLLPFLFGVDQHLLWLFEGVDYYEEKKRRKTVRDSHGISYRGAYAGRSESHSVEWSEMVMMGSGMIAMTSKYLFFAGGGVSLRIPYSKIVTVNPYTDALEIIKDGVTAKRQVFQNVDGCFAHDLLKAIAR